MDEVGFCLRMPPLAADGGNRRAHRQAWENLHAAGIKHLSITATWSPPFSSAPVATQKQWLQEFEFKLSSIHYHGPFYARPDKLAEQKLLRRDLVEFVRRHGELSPRAIVVHAGCAFGASSNLDTFNAFKDNCRRFGRGETLAIIAENASRMADEAARHGMKLALENMGRLLPVGDMASLGQVVALTGRDNVGFCVDSGHAHCCGEDVVAWLEFAGGRLFETHFHDNSARAAGASGEFVEAAGIDEHLFPGLGTINWRNVIESLGSAGYARPVMFECPGLPAQNPVDGYVKAVEWWRNCRSPHGQSPEETP